jgi:hypothetical protein
MNILGIYISNTHSKSVLLESLLDDHNLSTTSNKKDTQVLGILHPDKNGQTRQESWSYHSIIGILNFLVHQTHPDITCTVHQCPLIQ